MIKPLRRSSSSSPERPVPIVMVVSVIVVTFFLTGIVLHKRLEVMDDEDLIAGKYSVVYKWDWRALSNSLRSTVNSPRSNMQMLTLRQEYERQYSFDKTRIHNFLNAQRVHPLPAAPNLPYDIFNCPLEPPTDYPYEWNALQVLEHWGVDETEQPSDYLYQGLCVFDWEVPQDRLKTETYRKAEVPFVLTNHDEVLETSERWSTPGYLEELLGDTAQRNEHSHNNHFMFWRETPFTERTAGLKPSTDLVKLSYAQWLSKAQQLQVSTDPQATQDHWYFRLNANRENDLNTFLYEELPFFLPEDDQSTLFMVNPLQERGINCRFGMKGVFAPAHFDSTRNWILLFGGRRRYLLSNYRECKHLQLFPPDHPSGRHSAVDWSRPREHIAQHPELAGFAKAKMNEVVLQAGDALYLPTNWFHAIVSLNINYQCNARSGMTKESWFKMDECGFFLGPHEMVQ